MTKIELKNNITSLLPDHLESVQAFKEVKDAFGGLGFLVIAVESENKELSEKFTDYLAPEIEKMNDVLYIESKRPSRYFLDRKFLYFSLADLEEMERRLDLALKRQKEGYSHTFSFLLDFSDEEEKIDLTFKDIQDKYIKKLGFVLQERASTDDGKFIAIKIKLKSHQQNLDESVKLIDQIKALEQASKTKFPEFKSAKIIYSGDHIQTLIITKLIKKRITWASTIITTLLLAIVWFYFRSLRDVFLLAFCLFNSILWTGAGIYFVFGHINIITGFAAGILAGLGSDYGIYILKRYQQERSLGKTLAEACQDAFEQTGRATSISMLSTCIAFMALMISDFNVSIELGLVGAMGLFFNFCATCLFIPALLVLLKDNSRVYPQVQELSELHPKITQIVLKVFRPRFPKLVVGLFLFSLIPAYFVSLDLNKIHFEDGRLDSIETPENVFYSKIVKIFGGTLQPTILLVNQFDEAKKVVRSFEKTLQEAHGYLPYRGVLGISHFIPEKQAEKKQIISRLIKKFPDSNFPIKSKKDQLIEDLKTNLDQEEIELNNLPKEITQVFRGVINPNQFAVFVFPNFTELTWQWMKDFATEIRSVREKYQVHFLPSDNPFLALDFVNMIRKESPKILFSSLLSILLILFLLLKPKILSLYVTVNLIGAILVLGACMVLLSWQINTMNVVAFPIILGTGIDCFIHFALRYQEDLNINKTLINKLPSIIVSNLTTMVGFSALLFVPSEGIRSLGQIIILALSIMTLLCAFIFPNFLTLGRPKKVNIPGP